MNDISKNKRRDAYDQEHEFTVLHAADSDEALLQYVRSVAEQLGRLPSKKEVVGASLLKCRLGPWPRMLEKAGLKTTKKEKGKSAVRQPVSLPEKVR